MRNDDKKTTIFAGGLERGNKKDAVETPVLKVEDDDKVKITQKEYRKLISDSAVLKLYKKSFGSLKSEDF